MHSGKKKNFKKFQCTHLIQIFVRVEQITGLYVNSLCVWKRERDWGRGWGRQT